MPQILTEPDLAWGETSLNLRAVMNLDSTAFEQICRTNPDLRLEQKATGELIIVPPHGGESSDISSEIGAQLRVWARRVKKYKVYDSNALYILSDGSKLSPDVSLLSRERWRKLSVKDRRSFMPAVPEFVVQVKSPSDRLVEVKAKMNDWMRNGVELGWLIHYDRRLAFVYSSDRVEEHDLSHDLIGSGPIDGFVLSLKEIEESLED